MANPLVSIVINNFNYGKYLARAIQTSLGQTYKNIEIIVVDDGSTDNSRDVIYGFEGSLKSSFQINAGQASAMNAGFEMSSGDVVVFLDADDVLTSTAAAEIVRNWDASYSKLHWNMLVVDENEMPTGDVYPRRPLDSGDLVDQVLKIGSYVTAPTSGNAFSREFLSQVMPIPTEAWKGYADCYLLFSAPFFGKIGKLTHPLSSYRRHGNNMTSHVKSDNVELSVIQKELRRDILQQQLITSLASRFKLKENPKGVFCEHYHLIMRLISSTLAPSTHPFSADNNFRVIFQLFKAVHLNCRLSLSRKFLLIIWALAFFFSFGRLRDRLAILAFRH